MDKNKVKEALRKKLKQEMSMTGTGASVTPGVGSGVATKYAFGKRDNKGTPKDWKAAPSIPNRPSKAMDYKELWEASVPDNIKKFAKRKGVTNIVNKVAMWAEKAGKRVMGGTAIGKDYSTLILDLTHNGSEVYINTDREDIEVRGYPVYDYNTFVNALERTGPDDGSDEESLNENYARFRNETKTRTKPEQFHNAVKEVKKKVNEINRLFEYMNRLQSELKESEGGLKTKKYTENALNQIKEATKQLFFKSTKLK